MAITIVPDLGLEGERRVAEDILHVDLPDRRWVEIYGWSELGEGGPHGYNVFFPDKPLMEAVQTKCIFTVKMIVQDYINRCGKG